MSIDRASDEERQKVIFELVKLGVLKFGATEKEFESFLARRQAAMDWSRDGAQSDSDAKTKKSDTAHQSVYSYYDAAEYQQLGTTPQQYKTNLYQRSINGGRDIVDDTGVKKSSAKGADPQANPLNLASCPQSNITVATNQQFVSSGGYFDKPKFDNYKKAKQATVLHAYAYEFENFSPTMIEEKKCDYITTTQGTDKKKFLELTVGIKDGKYVDMPNADAKPLYLNTEEYTKLIKENLLKQMRAVVHAHAQSGIKDGIQMNLTLPGMGYFANLGGVKGEHSITSTIAQFAADGYRQAIEEFGNEQNAKNTKPKIVGVRLSYPPPKDGKKNVQEIAITNSLYADDKTKNKLGGITVAGTTRYVEELDDKKGTVEVVCVNGDPRTYPGNEQERSSQEPGVYANIANGRDNLSPIIHPFSAFSKARHFSHDSARTLDQKNTLDTASVATLESALNKCQADFRQQMQMKAKEKLQIDANHAVSRLGKFLEKDKPSMLSKDGVLTLTFQRPIGTMTIPDDFNKLNTFLNDLEIAFRAEGFNTIGIKSSQITLDVDNINNTIHYKVVINDPNDIQAILTSLPATAPSSTKADKKPAADISPAPAAAKEAEPVSITLPHPIIRPTSSNSTAKHIAAARKEQGALRHPILPDLEAAKKAVELIKNYYAEKDSKDVSVRVNSKGYIVIKFKTKNLLDEADAEAFRKAQENDLFTKFNIEQLRYALEGVEEKNSTQLVFKIPPADIQAILIKAPAAPTPPVAKIEPATNSIVTDPPSDKKPPTVTTARVPTWVDKYDDHHEFFSKKYEVIRKNALHGSHPVLSVERDGKERFRVGPKSLTIRGANKEDFIEMLDIYKKANTDKNGLLSGLPIITIDAESTKEADKVAKVWQAAFKKVFPDKNLENFKIHQIITAPSAVKEPTKPSDEPPPATPTPAKA